MFLSNPPPNPKLYSWHSAAAKRDQEWQKEYIVFTNGCFDILHPGHVDYLQRARALGTFLCLGLNSDASVRRLKGPNRPMVPEADRAFVLAGLGCVDAILLFEDDTPYELIRTVRPHILVKGGDWSVERIIGRDLVQNAGGKVLSLPVLPGYSTSAIIERIQQEQI